jgi:hypothetical protein
MNAKQIRMQLWLLGMIFLPAVVQAQFTFTTNADNTLTITAYTGGGGDVTVPDTINGLPVANLGDGAFNGLTNLTNVTVSTNVTSIGSWVFQGCSSLVTATLPDNITNIGDGTFMSCWSLSNIRIPTNVPSIAVWEFKDCYHMTNVSIPGSVTSIGDTAFAGCASLTNLAIPDGVTHIGSGAFWFCTGLGDVKLPSGLTSIEGATFYCCYGLNNITIGNNVTNIGVNAFNYCISLTNLTIPKSVTYIDDYAFYYCTGLKGLYFKGNAPGLGQIAVFMGDTNATVYYLPGTTNWPTPPPALYGGLSTALWLPAIQASDAGFGVQTNQFGFNLNWASDQTVVVEASTNLLNWQPVQTNTLTTGSAWFSDPQWTNYPGRFYRLRSP